MQVPLVLAAICAMAQDKPAELKDNPLYKYWTDCKVGSWVKMTMSYDQAGQKVEIEQVQKLLEITEDKVVVEVTGTTKLGAQEFPSPAQKQDIKAREPGDKVKIEKEGDEEIEVAGKKLKCHWFEASLQTGPKTMKMKGWLAKEIPGGMAKLEMSPEGLKVLVQNAVAWEKK